MPLGVQRYVGSLWALWRRGGCHKKDNNLFLKPINTDIYGTIIEQADL